MVEKEIYDEIDAVLTTTPIEMLDLLATESKEGAKRYTKCVENVARIIENHPEFAGRFRYDEWTLRYEVRIGEKWRQIKDEDYRAIQARISVLYEPFRTIGKDIVVDGVLVACERHKIDTASDWIRGIEWDGVPRVDGWLTTVYGVANDLYHRSVAGNFMKGMVKRIVDPGCKFDCVLLLKGRQGCGKTTSMEILGGEWYTGTTVNLDNKDFFLQFRGNMIVDLSEGASVTNTDLKKMKSIITERIDTYREPYGRTTQSIPRRCVFIMTTNQETPLRDETGNRRFFPVEVARPFANVEWLTENRDQLFAEAYARVRSGESVHEFDASSEQIQSENMEESPFEQTIADWVERPTSGTSMIPINLSDGVTVADVWKDALGGDVARFGRKDMMQIGVALKALGFEKRRVMYNGVQKMRWFRI